MEITERIEHIYADLKLADRLTPGRTPWQTLRRRAEDIALMDADDGTRCPICHARGGHSLSCPTRWHS